MVDNIALPVTHSRDPTEFKPSPNNLKFSEYKYWFLANIDLSASEFIPPEKVFVT